jgi:hypothetical protein
VTADDRTDDPQTGAGGGAPDRPEESAGDRLDRNFGELLQELRVAQTGVQILFAFLLTFPFTNRFALISHLDRVAYVVTLIAAALASGLLIAPVSYHRLAFRQGRKPELVHTASILAGCGMVCLLIAVVGGIFVVMDMVAGPIAATVTAGAIAICYCVLWYVLPLSHRRGHAGDRRPAA